VGGAAGWGVHELSSSRFRAGMNRLLMFPTCIAVKEPW
jgi:hypothetical protein